MFLPNDCASQQRRAATSCINVVSAVTELGAGLLIVGSRGHGAIAGVVLGQRPHALIRHSPVPATIVRKAAVPGTTGA